MVNVDALDVDGWEIGGKRNMKYIEIEVVMEGANKPNERNEQNERTERTTEPTYEWVSGWIASNVYYLSCDNVHVKNFFLVCLTWRQ